MTSSGIQSNKEFSESTTYTVNERQAVFICTDDVAANNSQSPSYTSHRSSIDVNDLNTMQTNDGARFFSKHMFHERTPPCLIPAATVNHAIEDRSQSGMNEDGSQSGVNEDGSVVSEDREFVVVPNIIKKITRNSMVNTKKQTSAIQETMTIEERHAHNIKESERTEKKKTDKEKEIDATRTKLLYFHPDIANMYEVNDVMKKYALQDGAFLVRNSFSKPGTVTVSVINNKGIKHFNISKAGDCYFIHSKRFHNIEELIRFYEHEDVPNVEGIRHVRLSTPIMYHNSKLFRRHRSENPSVLKQSSQPYTMLQSDTQTTAHWTSQDNTVDVSSEFSSHNMEAVGQSASQVSQRNNPSHIAVDKSQTASIDDITRSLPHKHKGKVCNIQKLSTNIIRKSSSIDDMPRSKPPSIPKIMANSSPDAFQRNANVSLDNPRHNIIQSSTKISSGFYKATLLDIPQNTASISPIISESSGKISACVSETKANLPPDFLHVQNPFVSDRDCIANKQDKMASSDSDPYYSTVRDMYQELAPSLIEHLRKQEIHGGCNGKCECGLYFEDAELPRGWSVHISSEPLTNGCIFFTSPAGETSWNLPLEVSIELSWEQQEVIRKLLERSNHLPARDVINSSTGARFQTSSVYDQDSGSSKKTSENCRNNLSDRNSLYGRLDESYSGFLPVLRPVTVVPTLTRQELGHFCTIKTSELDLVVHCSEDVGS